MTSTVEHRSQPRIDVNYPISVRVLSTPERSILPGRLLNISQDGAGLITQELIPVNSLVQLELPDVLMLGEVTRAVLHREGHHIGVRVYHSLNKLNEFNPDFLAAVGREQPGAGEQLRDEAASTSAALSNLGETVGRAGSPAAPVLSTAESQVPDGHGALRCMVEDAPEARRPIWEFGPPGEVPQMVRVGIWRKHLSEPGESHLHPHAEDLLDSNAFLEQLPSVVPRKAQGHLRRIAALGIQLSTNSDLALGPDDLDYLDRVQDAAVRTQALIRDLLSLARLSGEAPRFETVPLSDVVQTVVSDLKARVDKTGGRVDIGPLPVVVADRAQMVQLFTSLIENALKFHKPSEPPLVRIHGEVTPDPQQHLDVCCVAIEDNGVGFDEKYAQKIFQVFVRLGGGNGCKGTGMGLAICRKIIEKHCGTIAANSAPGKGATFTITLPIRAPEERTTNG